MKNKYLVLFLFICMANHSCKKCELLEQTITDPVIPCAGTFYINNGKDQGGSEFSFFFNEFSKPLPSPFIYSEIGGPHPVLTTMYDFEFNFSALDTLNNRYAFQYTNDVVSATPVSLLHIHDFNTNTSSFVSTTRFSAPVFLNGRLYGIRSNLRVNEVVQMDPISGQEFGKVATLNFTPISPFDLYGISSTTDGKDLLYFLSGTNLIEVKVSDKSYRHIDIDPTYDQNNNPVNYNGLEFKRDEGLLIAMKNTIDANNTSITDLVICNPNSTNPIATLRFDLHNHLSANQDKVINSDFHSTTFDQCDNTYYIIEFQNSKSYFGYHFNSN
ncbi:MAG: hypothetical protein IPG95_14785 [Saprospiraceae bacterium]|nr:hypothetical protein [Saprospiraceae bacterium]